MPIRRQAQDGFPGRPGRLEGLPCFGRALPRISGKPKIAYGRPDGNTPRKGRRFYPYAPFCPKARGEIPACLDILSRLSYACFRIVYSARRASVRTASQNKAAEKAASTPRSSAVMSDVRPSNAACNPSTA